MLKEQKGITLVALIITIIVMLILAGVSISLVVGEGGVLNQAQSVEPKQVEGALKEAVALANADMIAEYYSNTSDYADKYTTANAATEIKDRIIANFSYANEYTIDGDLDIKGTADLTVSVKGETVTVEVEVDDSKDYYQISVSE